MGYLTNDTVFVLLQYEIPPAVEDAINTQYLLLKDVVLGGEE